MSNIEGRIWLHTGFKLLSSYLCIHHNQYHSPEYHQTPSNTRRNLRYCWKVGKYFTNGERMKIMKSLLRLNKGYITKYWGEFLPEELLLLELLFSRWRIGFLFEFSFFILALTNPSPWPTSPFFKIYCYRLFNSLKPMFYFNLKVPSYAQKAPFIRLPIWSPARLDSSLHIPSYSSRFQWDSFAVVRE